MIQSFKSKALEKFWTKGDTRGLRQDHIRKISIVLNALNVATKPSDMDRPSFAFHALKGGLAGHYAVKVNANWRIIFGWTDTGPGAVEVDYVDYH